jgi:hypothetical protein
VPNILEQFREHGYPNARNSFAKTALDLGGASSGPEAKELLHEGGNYALTKKLHGVGVPAQLAANTSDLAFLGNEAFTGTLAALTGRPFFSDYGFRWGDVATNRRGQDRALTDISAEQAAEEPYRRGWRGIRTPAASDQAAALKK